MNRVVALYALAVPTLIGAFFLVARPNTPPPPEPPPVPVAGQPIDHLVYADGLVSVEALLDRGHLLQGALGDEPMYLDVTVRAFDVGGRAPVTAVLVIDRSGSMAGEGIENARFAADRFIRRLNDGDRVAVVSYATDVTVDFPLAVVDPVTRTAALRTVARIEEGGGTNIDGGLRAAAGVLDRALVDAPDAVNRLVLISDGRPTEGDRRDDVLARYATNLRAKGISTSAIGVGLDYNEDLLTRIAVEGGGRYHYLREARLLPKILNDELDHATRVVARDVELALPTNLGLLRVEAVPGQLATIGATTTVTLGDLAAGEERHVLFVLAPIPSQVEALPQVQFSPPAVRYRSTTAGALTLTSRSDQLRVVTTSDPDALAAGRRPEVTARVLALQAASVLEESMQQYTSGRVHEAQSTLRAKATALREANKVLADERLADEVQNIERVLSSTEAAAPSAEAGAALVKEQKARAYQLRR